MEIKKSLLPAEKLKPLYRNALSLEFGKLFTDYMFTMQYNCQREWHEAEIKPYQPLSLDPAARVLHYAQEVFEGQKAFKTKDNDILLFRAEQNARRLNHSLKRLAMPPIPEEFFLEAEKELLKLEARWVPKEKGAALYLRPTVIATEAALGVAPANEYLFYIICSPVGPYFQTGFKPVKIFVSDFYSRAGLGGTGDAKAGGNYAASLYITKIAKQQGYNQVLFLDSCQKKYIEELGGMNVFFVFSDTLVTPPLSGTILAGITRDSVIQLAKHLAIKVEERLITIDEILEAISKKTLKEAFACGTAAVISPIGTLFYKNKEYQISTEAGKITTLLYNELTAIQYGEKEDIFNWCIKI